MAQQLVKSGSFKISGCGSLPCRKASFRPGYKPFQGSTHHHFLSQLSTLAPRAQSCHGIGSRSQKASPSTCHAFKHGSVYFWGQQDAPFTVAKVQIGVFGDVSRFQRELNRLAMDPESEELSRLLRESCLFLSSNYQNCAYASAQLEPAEDLDQAERIYNAMTLEERSRFKEETLVNIGGDLRTSAWPRNEVLSRTTADQWLCCTFVVALDGNLKLPRLDSITALRDSLLKLGSLAQDDVIALELLWTPQAAGDSYTRDELLADYPTLLTLL